MIIELSQLVISGVLAEIARRLDLKMKIEVRKRVFQLHHNIIGLSCIISSLLFPQINILFFGSGLVLHHLIREGW